MILAREPEGRFTGYVVTINLESLVLTSCVTENVTRFLSDIHLVRIYLF